MSKATVWSLCTTCFGISKSGIPTEEKLLPHSSMHYAG